MSAVENIIIGDKSALHLYLHSACEFMENGPDRISPFLSSSQSSESLHAFNCEHPLYGGKPVDLMVPYQELRRRSQEIRCHSIQPDLPAHAFYELRQGLHIISPELAFVRAGLAYPSDIKLIELAMNLCARYYISLDTEIKERSRYLTTPEKIAAFTREINSVRGTGKALRVLKYVRPNSGSPLETKAVLQFCLPCRLGGFNLPLSVMNYDVKAGRYACLLEQNDFSIDLVNTQRRFGLEYDGKRYHLDASKDKQRRNELAVLGWRIYPLDAQIIYDPEATIRAAEQLAVLLNVRIRRPNSWLDAFMRLRTELDLPC